MTCCRKLQEKEVRIKLIAIATKTLYAISTVLNLQCFKNNNISGLIEETAAAAAATTNKKTFFNS